MCIIATHQFFWTALPAAIVTLNLAKHWRSDLKLLNNGCKGGWGPAAVLQQVHASVVVADISGENQEFGFSGQEDVCNPLALLP